MTWEWHELGDLLRPQANRKAVQQGWSPRCHPNPATEGAWGVLKTTAIQEGRFEPEHNKELPEHLAPRDQIEVHAGDLLMTCAGPRSRCGVPALVRKTPPRLMMSGKMYRMRPDDRVLPSFLELWLRSPDAQRRIDRMKTGISDSGLNLTQDRFVALPVPVPPLDEQRRIVALLDGHLSRLDAADVYVRSATQRLSNAGRSALDRLFGGRDIPLTNLVDNISAGKSYGAANAPAAEDEWGIIKVSAMTRGKFDPAENKAVPRERADPRFEIREGDLLVSRANTGEYVGASVLVGPVRAKLLLSDKSLRLSPADGVRPDWLWRALQAPSARRQISALATGTKDSMRNISQASLMRVQVPRAVPQEQEAAVNAYAEIAAAIDRLRTELDSAHRRSAGLRRSLLAAAFSGQLTDETPIA